MDKVSEISKEISGVESGLMNTLTSAGYVTGIILGVIGLILVMIEINLFYKIHQISQWPTIRDGGTIKDSYLENTSDSWSYSVFLVSESFSNLYYRNRVSFVYNAKGKQYLSTKYSFYEPWETNPIVAKIENDTYKPKTKVNILVNPVDPSEAYITNKPYTNYNRLVVGLILTILGIYSIYNI